LRKAAGLAHLRFHDLRHHAITELADSEASEQTIYVSCRTRVQADAGALLPYQAGCQAPSS
jgi:hypothetical protein